MLCVRGPFVQIPLLRPSRSIFLLFSDDFIRSNVNKDFRENSFKYRLHCWDIIRVPLRG